MVEYQIKMLKMGTLYGEKSSLTMGIDFGVPIPIPMWSAAIEGNGHKIVVDTGIKSLEWTKENLGDQYEVEQESDETMEAALEHIGWKPEEVDIVINTHLHYDHCGSNYLFKNAKFYLQSSEWDYAFQPVKNQECFYYEELFGWQAVRYTSWKMLSGEYQILPGLRVIPLGGHSVGGQGVFVNTKEGIVCLAMDAVGLYENLENNILPNIMTNVEDGFKAFDIIRNNSDFVIPGHDTCINKYQSSNFPVVNK
ncbi:MAG: N-acyl homoserine lactonase family protein [Clostridiaceae bacterium]|nr:N-acyl homoserine lactonase family protein [Clostridiaceae bacterium]